MIDEFKTASAVSLPPAFGTQRLAETLTWASQRGLVADGVSECTALKPPWRQ